MRCRRNHRQWRFANSTKFQRGGGGRIIHDGTTVWIIDDTRELSPIGDVVGKTYLPQGYVKANGATVNRADYPRLVNLAEKYNLWTDDVVTYPAMFGKGDGSATFVLPDWRGVVIRFLDDGKGYDVGRVLGSYQADLLVKHTHVYQITTLLSANGHGSSTPVAHSNNYYDTSTSATGGAETRMKNISVLAVMRY